MQLAQDLPLSILLNEIQYSLKKYILFFFHFHFSKVPLAGSSGGGGDGVGGGRASGDQVDIVTPVVSGLSTLIVVVALVVGGCFIHKWVKTTVSAWSE